MSSLDFCVCGGSKNQNQELCGECRMAEIEAVTLKHTWQEEPADDWFAWECEMTKCFCGEYGVSTSKRTYNLCLSHIRQMLESAYKENKTEFEEKLYDHFILSPDRDWNITEFVIESLINALFFSGNEFEYFIPNEYVSGLEE